MSPHHKVDRMKVEADSTGKAKMSGWWFVMTKMWTVENEMDKLQVLHVDWTEMCVTDSLLFTLFTL